MKNEELLHWRSLFLIAIFFIFGCLQSKAEIVKGTVVDDTGEPLIGATVRLLNAERIAAVTDIDGNFSLNVSDLKSAVLAFSYIGMKPLEVKVNGREVVNVTLQPTENSLEEVIVVGYGQQKKASVVGAIAQTTGDVLERAAGVHDISSALTGNLPGVVTMASYGMPGDESASIVIRSASSWNNSAPLVLVDGVERDMASVDVGSVKTISILKDASATAVYGVKGANGVILITTKRAKLGEAVVSVDAKWGANSKGSQNYDYITDPAQYYETYYSALYNYAHATMTDAFGGQGMSSYDAWKWANSQLAQGSNPGLGYISYTHD